MRHKHYWVSTSIRPFKVCTVCGEKTYAVYPPQFSDESLDTEGDSVYNTCNEGKESPHDQSSVHRSVRKRQRRQQKR